MAFSVEGKLSIVVDTEVLWNWCGVLVILWVGLRVVLDGAMTVWCGGVITQM